MCPERLFWGGGSRGIGPRSVTLLASMAVLAALLALVSAVAVSARASAAEVTPASIAVGTYPQGVDVSTDGTFALVANSGSDTVSRIRTSDNVVVATIPVGDGPGSVAIAPDDSFALVTNYWGGSMSRIRTSDNTVTATITGFSVPVDVAIAPDGSFAYVTNAGTDSVARIRLSDNLVTGTTAVGDAPIGVALAPDGSFAYVANSQSSTVSRIRTSDNTVVATTSVGVAGTQPLFIAMSPDGTFAYVNTGGNSSVARIRTSDNTLVTSIAVPGGAQKVAISPDGTFAYVTLSTAGNLSRIRTSDNSVTATFGVGSGPYGVAIAPGSAFAYVTRQVPGLVARVEAPGAPNGLVATPGNGQASIVFTPPPSDVAITNYQYSINDGATWVNRNPASAATPLVITGLVNGTTYNVRLRAINPLGTGPTSAAVAVQPKTVPGLPKVTSVTPGPGSVTVVFEPPSETGGVPITNYQWTVNDGASWNSRIPASTASPLVISGLTNSIHAKVKLRAVNAAGAGPATVTVTVTVGSIPVGSRPGSVAIAPDGSFAYVTNRLDNTVSRVRTADDVQVATIGVGAAPGSVAFAPDGTLAFVTNKNGNTVTAVQTATNTVSGTYGVGNTPVAAAFAVDSTFAYVVNQGAGTVTKLSAAGAALKTIKVGTWPTDVKMAPNGTFAYVANGWERTISKIDTTTDTVVATIAIGTPQIVGNPYAGGPTRIAFAPDSSYAYITNDDDATLARVTTTTKTVTKLGLGGTPRGVAFRPDGIEAYVTNEAADTVLRVRTSDTTLQSMIFVGMAPSSVAYAPDGSFAYVANSGERSLSRIGVAGAPTALVATPGDASASIAFAPPASDGGASVSNYKYATSTNSGGTWSSWTALSPADAASPVTIPGLANGTAYLVKLRAVTSNGDGTPSEAVAVTPRTVPTAPTITAATGGVRQVSVGFTPPASNGGAVVTTYEYSLDGGAWTPRNPASAASPLLITGLADGATLAIRVRAVNAAGPGAPSNSYVSATLPRLAAPTGLAATPGAESAQVAFTAPLAPPGVPVTNYKFSLSSNAGASWSAWTELSPADAASPVLIPGLANGTSYLIKLLAVNAVGDGAASTASAAFVPRTVPSAPTALVATAGDMSASVTFAAGSNGGAAITNYKYSTDDGATWITRAPASTGSPLVITGLANGTTYQVRLRAVNAAGDGAVSAVVAVTPTAPVDPAGTVFVPVDPARVADTRTAFGGAGPIPASTSRVLSVAATQADGVPVVPAGAAAIVFNLTVPNPTAGGHVRVMPGDAATLTTSSAINFRPGETIANGLTVKIDAQRQIAVYAAVTADVVVDVVGYFVPVVAPNAAEPEGPAAVAPLTPLAGRFTAVTPVRVYDARSNPAGPLAGNSSRLVSTATAQDGTSPVVPSGAAAVAYNITVVRPSEGGHLRVMPGDVTSSEASTINWTMPGDVISNGLTVGVDAERQLRVFNNTSQPVTFLLDVVGYYSTSGALFYPADPERVLETRTSLGGAGPITTGEAGQRTVSVATALAGGAEQVPVGATAIAYNLTATRTTSSGHLRVWPAGAPLVDASTMNWPDAGYSRANGTVVAISVGREVTIHNGSTTPTDALIDTLGYYK